MKTWPQNGVGTVAVFASIDVLIVCPQNPLQCLTHGKDTHKTLLKDPLTECYTQRNYYDI